jgi:hypothetical protein
MKITAHFKSGTSKVFLCDFVGNSVDYPPLLLLFNEEGDEDESIPVAMINSEEVSYIQIEEDKTCPKTH